MCLADCKVKEPFARWPSTSQSSAPAAYIGIVASLEQSGSLCRGPPSPWLDGCSSGTTWTSPGRALPSVIPLLDSSVQLGLELWLGLQLPQRLFLSLTPRLPSPRFQAFNISFAHMAGASTGGLSVRSSMRGQWDAVRDSSPYCHCTWA